MTEKRMNVKSILLLRQACVLAWLVTASGCGPTPEVVEVPKKTPSTQIGVEQKVVGMPITATLRLECARAKAGDSIGLSVKLNVGPLWEIRTLDAEPKSAATQLELALPSELQAVGEWQAPEPMRSINPNGHAVYAGEAVFTRSLSVAEDTPVGELKIKCRVSYQACNDRKCLRPTAIELEVPLHIE